MYNMAFTVNHDIAVVTIFDLEDIASNRVCSHGLNEIQPCFLEGNCVGSSILRDEEGQ